MFSFFLLASRLSPVGVFQFGSEACVPTQLFWAVRRVSVWNRQGSGIRQLLLHRRVWVPSRFCNSAGNCAASAMCERRRVFVVTFKGLGGSSCFVNNVFIYVYQAKNIPAVCGLLCTVHSVQHSGCRTSICGSAVGCVTLRAELCRFARVTQCVRTPTNHRPVFLHFLPFCGMYFLTHFSFLSIKQLFTAPDDIVLQLPQVYPRPACQSAANSASVSAAARASSGHCENQ